MKFSMSHRFFNTPPEIFDDTSIPDWLSSKAYKWWFDDHVCKLGVGESIDSDFRRITRIE